MDVPNQITRPLLNHHQIYYLLYQLIINGILLQHVRSQCVGGVVVVVGVPFVSCNHNSGWWLKLAGRKHMNLLCKSVYSHSLCFAKCFSILINNSH